MRVLTILALLSFVVFFVIGFVAPRRSRRLERKLDRGTRRKEGMADRKAGKLGDMTRKSLELYRRGSDRSLKAGRQVRDKVS